MASDSPQPEQVVNGYIAWVNGDASTVGALAESVDVYNPGLADGEVHDRAAYDAYIQDPRSGRPDLQFTAERTVARGDVVIGQFTITGTHDGERKGTPPTGFAWN